MANEPQLVKVSFKKSICFTDGTPLQDGQTVRVMLRTNDQSDDGFPFADLVAVDVLDDGKSFTYDRTLANQSYRRKDILGIDPQNDCACAEQCNFNILAAVAYSTDISSIEVDGSAITLPNFPYVAATDTAQLETDLIAYLNTNHPQTEQLPTVHVTEVGGDWNIEIAASVLDFQTVNAAQAFVNSCD